MLPSWLQARYPGQGPSPEHYVPRWDPLRRDRLPEDFPDLEHVPQSTEVVFQHWPVETLVQRVVTWALFAFLAVELGRPVTGVALFPLFLPVWFAAAVVLAALALKNSRSVQLALPQIVAVPVVFAAALLIDTGTRAGGAQLAVSALALFLAGLFLDTLARHALDLRIAGGAFSDDERARILGVWQGRFDVRAGLTSYVLGLSPLLVAVVLSLLDAPLFVLLVVPTLAALLVIGAFHGYEAVVSSLREFLHSLELWTDYGLRGEGSPGVVRTTAGERHYRLLLVPVVLFALASILLPREAHIVDFARGVRLLDVNTLWALVLTLTGGVLLPIVTLTAAGAASVGAFLLETDSVRPADETSAGELAERSWNRLVTRLQSSANALHRRQLLVGFHATEHYPVLLPVKTLQEHVHILGGSGGGKTSRAFLPLVAQLTRYGTNGTADLARDDNLRGPIVVVDLKGEPYLFQATREEARKSGRKFRFFANVSGRATYAFNPVLDLKELGLPPERIGTTVHAALNLEHGTGYGKGYYSAVTRGLLQELFTAFPHVESLRELSEMFRKRRSRPEDKKRDEEAYELISSLDLLGRREELNVTSRTGHRPDVLDERIRMSRVIDDDEVLYMYFGSHGDEAGARFVASLALECLYTAAVRRQETSSAPDPKPVFILIDEFQMVAGRNFAMFLQLARSAGLALILSNQSRESLRELDLLHALDENTAYRQFFTARTPEALAYLEEIGGMTAEDSQWGFEERAGGSFPGAPPRSASRLTRNTLITLSAEPDLSLAVQTVNRDYAQYDGFPIVLRAPFHISDETRKTLQSRPWPTDPGTLVIGDGREEGTASRGQAASDDDLDVLFARIHVTTDGYTVDSSEA